MIDQNSRKVAPPAKPSSDPDIDRVLSGYVKKKVREEATRQGVPEDFADRMASAESAYKPDVIKGQRKSRVGAQGPMQLMPGTARDLKVDPDHINQNIEGGVRYAKQQLDAFGGDQRKASAAYNWGPGNVRKFGTDRAPAETRAYMDKVGGNGSPSADPEIEALLQAYQARKTTPQPQRNVSPGVFKQRPQAPNAGRKLAENLLDFRSGQNAPMAQAARLDAAIAPEVKQQRETRDARMRKSREEYDRKSFLGRRASDVASGLENIGQSGQRAFENALTFSGVRDVLEMNDTAKNALAEGKAAQQYTAQKMQEEQAARNAMASQVTRGLTQGAGGAAIMAPLAMTGGVPALMAGTGLQQDWENDPKGALLNTATAGVPVLAGKAIAPIAGRAAMAMPQGLQKATQLGIEGAAGGAANAAQYAGTQAVLGREINPEEALVQGVTGAALSGAMAPKLGQVRRQIGAQNVRAERPTPLNALPERPVVPTTQGPTARVRVTPGDFQRANLETQKGFTQPLTEPLAPTPQVVPAAPVTPDAAPAVAGMPNRADFEPGFLGDVEYQGALANAQRVAKPAKAAAAKPAYDPAAFRGAIDDAKIQAGEAEAAGNWESARDQYKSAMDTITEMQKEARRNRDAAALSELAREKSATNTNWQVAKRNAERAAKMPAPKAPEAARQMPQVQQAQQIASGAKSSLGNAEKPLSQVNLQETAPTRDLSAPLDDRTASQDEAIRGRGNVRELEVSPAEAALREREALPPIERRRALRDATYKGQFGKLSEAARKRGDRETSLAENPQLRRLLDLPEMPPYRLPDAPINPKTGEPYVNPAWTEAAQDTLNALAAVAGKERSSQINFGPGELSGGQQPSLAGKINPQTGKPYVYNIPPKGQPTRGEAGDLFLAVQELARKRGEQIDPSLRAAFKGTVEGARTAKAGYEAFVVDERLDDIENSLREIYRRGKLSSKDNTAHRDAFREIAAEYGVSTARADANFAGIKAQAASRAQRAGEAQPAGEDQGRSEGRSRPVVGAVEQRATGTDGRSAEGGGRAAVQKAKPVEKPARPAKSTEQQLADVDKMLAMDAITEKAAASMKERIRAAAKRASFGPLENEPSGPVATMFGGQKILDNLRAGRRPQKPKEIPADFDAQAWVRKAAENLAKQTLSDADKAKVADPNTTAAEKAKIYAAAKPDPARETAFRTTMGEAFAALSANDYNGFQDAANRLKAISDAPATNWEKATAIRKAAMLSRPVSHLRNLIGNTAFQNLEEVARIPGSIGDMLLSGVTGRRTLQGASVEDSARAIYEAATGGITAAKDAMAGRSNEEIAKALQTREVNFNNKVVDKAVKFVFRSLGAEDQIFYTGAYDRAIREAAKLTARNEARQGVINRADIKKRQDALLAAPTPAMEVDATLAAETAVFRNSNKLSEGIAGFRDKIGDKGNFALDLVLPFDKTPTNVVFRALEYSPLGVARGAVKGVAGAARAIGARRTANKNGAPSKADVQAAIDKAFTPAQQRSAAQLLGRGTVGTGLLALGYALASKGMMTGFYDDEDYKGEAMKRATGAQPLAIKIKDRWYGLQGIGPIGMALGMGATMQQEANKKGGDIYGGAAKAAKEQVLETPLLSSMKDLSKDVERVSKDRANAGKLVGNLASSFVPGVLTDIEPFVSPLAPDQFEREVKDDPKKVKGMRRALREGGGQVAAKIPGVRRLLPVKRDITGKPVPSRPLQAIDPFSSRPATGRLPVKRR